MNERRVFLEDLEATDARHVRKKLLLGEYNGWQAEIAKNWLDDLKAQKSGRWKWVTPTASVGGVLLTGLAKFLGLF